jgi:hypothetical protein
MPSLFASFKAKRRDSFGTDKWLVINAGFCFLLIRQHW